jgi:hypothetical protein
VEEQDVTDHEGDFFGVGQGFGGAGVGGSEGEGFFDENGPAGGEDLSGDIAVRLGGRGDGEALSFMARASLTSGKVGTPE